MPFIFQAASDDRELLHAFVTQLTDFLYNMTFRTDEFAPGVEFIKGTREEVIAIWRSLEDAKAFAQLHVEINNADAAPLADVGLWGLSLRAKLNILERLARRFLRVRDSAAQLVIRARRRLGSMIRRALGPIFKAANTIIGSLAKALPFVGSFKAEQVKEYKEMLESTLKIEGMIE